MSWQKIRLADIASMRTGKLDSNAAVPGGDYPFFTCSQQTLRINEPAFDTEAVILGGNNAAGIFPLKYYHGQFNAYQRTYIIESRNQNLLNIRFLFYALRPALSHFQSASIGAATQYLTKSILDNFPVSLPPIREQQNIADILSAYDELIENNRRRMQLLEEAARLLYKEWFVRLRFPYHEHVKIKDGVPEGWERVPLGKVAIVNRASLSKNFQGEIEYIDISAVGPSMIDETTFHRFADAPSRARRRVQHGDIIWSCVRPNRRSHAVIWRPPENLIVSTGFAVLTPLDLPTTFLYQAVTTDEFVGYLANNARGAAYPAVTASDFEKAMLMVPKKIYLEQFDEITKPLLEQVQPLHLQTTKLTKARDLLLPRLMNGEIAV